MNTKYPRGKLNDSDEGQTALAIYVTDKTVMIHFPKPIAWIGMSKQEALTLADMIKTRAETIK